MPTGALAKKLLLFTGVGLVVLLLVGFIFGAVGSAMLGTDQFLDKPEIHLPPQPIFPADVRDEHLGLFQVNGEDHGENAEAHFTPLGATEIAVTNTLLSSWFTTVVLILIFVTAARRRSVIPGRFQGFVETMIEGVLGFASSVLGPEMARKTFPVVATIFFFVLFNAWLALLPFYQFLGFTQDGEIKAHFLRSAGTDINMPLALALISFVFVEYWGFRARGFSYLKKFFQLGKIFRGKPSGLIDAFVGFLELTSELVRVVSFTFRLFGNMTAGEILVVMITFLVPFVATQFVFGLELLVGLIQAVIFAGLTLVFLSVATSHEEH
ncbi:MAG: F0F1 ATP synthase subunit A [Dehalococcoidia bacterium]|nr:F0F1 ATP synthase subunit A [Dehalococcoidia bacterium]